MRVMERIKAINAILHDKVLARQVRDARSGRGRIEKRS